MRIRWHGHSCFEIQDSITVVTDPHDGKSLGIPRPVVRGDVVLVSHDHFDHNSVRVVRGIDTEVLSFKPGVSTVRGVTFRGFTTYHDKSHGEQRGKNVVYCFEMDGINLCHLGDLGDIPPVDVIEEMKPVDIVFTPVGNVFTIGAAEAKKMAELLGARVVVPMHYRVGGLSLSIRPVDDFLRLYPEDRIVKVGNEIEFTKEDLPPEQEVWVFTL